MMGAAFDRHFLRYDGHTYSPLSFRSGSKYIEALRRDKPALTPQRARSNRRRDTSLGHSRYSIYYAPRDLPRSIE